MSTQLSPRASRAAVLATLCVVMPTSLIGCAAIAKRGIQTYDRVELELDRPESERFHLVDARGRRIAQSGASSGTISFAVEGRALPAGCYAVLTDRGRSPVPGSRRISVDLPARHGEAVDARRAATVDAERIRAERQGYVRELDHLAATVRENPAYASGSCRVPGALPFPAEPFAPCRSRSEFLKEGAAICYVQLFGAEGCGMAFSKYGVPSAITSPACGAAVAKLANEKYGLGDALLDAIQGAIDDHAAELWGSGSTGDQLGGAFLYGLNLVAKAARAQSCTNGFVDRFYGPRERWLSRVREIESEPQQRFDECTDNLAAQSDNIAAIRALDARLAASRDRASALDERLATLTRERKKLSYCED